MMFLQGTADMVQRDPFWYGVAITALGIAVIVERLVRGKPLTKIRVGGAIAVMLMGAGISFGFLERLLEPVLALVERFAR